MFVKLSSAAAASAGMMGQGMQGMGMGMMNPSEHKCYLGVGGEGGLSQVFSGHAVQIHRQPCGCLCGLWLFECSAAAMR
jgi:hypothetical protein